MGKLKIEFDDTKGVTIEIPAKLAINIINRMYDEYFTYGRSVTRYLARLEITFDSPETFLAGLRKLTDTQLRELLELI